jgi:hypothetical protein
MNVLRVPENWLHSTLWAGSASLLIISQLAIPTQGRTPGVLLEVLLE